ncbi:MAG: hypothetical protein ACRERU_01645 [Methylococcales bacterium]
MTKDEEPLFLLLYYDALSGHERAAAAGEVIFGTVRGVLGLLTGKAANGAASVNASTSTTAPIVPLPASERWGAPSPASLGSARPPLL